MEPALFSFFSGSGFLDLGFEKNGFRIVMANELHQPFMSAYEYSRKRMGIEKPVYGNCVCSISDFRDCKRGWLLEKMAEARQKHGLVGFVGGPPCPDFSIAGKNMGRKGKNGQLSYVYASLICDTKPDFFIFENVKGLWSTAVHRQFFDLLVRKLQRAGYRTTCRLTNALEYGAPQDRDRIILFGALRSSMGGKFKRSEISDFPWESFTINNVGAVKGLSWPTQDPFIPNSTTDCPDGLPKELTVEYWFEKNHVSNHPNADMYFMPKAGLGRMKSIDEGDVSRKSYKRLHRWRYSPTAAYGE